MKFSSKGLNERVVEQSGDGTLEKYRKFIDDKVINKSTSRGFRTRDITVAMHEQTKRGLSHFDPKRFVEYDGIHTDPLKL